MNNFTDQKAEAYDFIAWLNSPAVSLDAVFGGVERWQPFRRSHTEAFDDGVGPPGQGLSPGAVEDYLQVSPRPARARAGCRPDARGRLTRRSLPSPAVPPSRPRVVRVAQHRHGPAHPRGV